MLVCNKGSKPISIQRINIQSFLWKTHKPRKQEGYKALRMPYPKKEEKHHDKKITASPSGINGDRERIQCESYTNTYRNV